ncbi:hypothetical protein GSI_02071 [Ganoderma sinense ZZ0214-1]|uniref:Uncharacterized protein n=1 Tax=Ganoderma sinense ZZ0214-1 TaxID=1077348 RepID=A0A2G8SNJ2_9APHY|nr:hypothetical protein GSI_02071 [Ganoderma sinense ZZ0214-1]
MNAAPTPDSPVPCPRLRSVDVTGEFVAEALSVTLRCLEDRAEKGHRLETITMNLWGREGDDVLFETNYVPRLQELVTECMYKCTEPACESDE